MAPQANGIALFRKDKLIGYLSPDEAEYFLFATGAVDGGILGFNDSSGGDRENTSLAISGSKTKAKWSYDGAQMTIGLDIHVDTALVESKADADPSQEDEQKRLEARAADVIRERVQRVIGKVQNEFGVDTFGFGNMVYKDDPSLWTAIGGDWDAVFAKAKLEIQVDVSILHTGVLAGKG
jgi:spore germination protein KC